MASNTTIKKLTLLNCAVDDEGAKYLAEALKSNTTLESLSLDINMISDEGAKSLSEAIQVNTSLKKLSVVKNKITDQGAYALVKPLYNSTITLKELDVAANDIVLLSEIQRKNVMNALKPKGKTVNFH